MGKIAKTHNGKIIVKHDGPILKEKKEIRKLVNQIIRKEVKPVVEKLDAKVVDKMPELPARTGKYYPLKEMGTTMKKGQAIRVIANPPIEATKIQSRWRSYFKGSASSRKTVEDGQTIVYLILK